MLVQKKQTWKLVSSKHWGCPAAMHLLLFSPQNILKSLFSVFFFFSFFWKLIFVAHICCVWQCICFSPHAPLQLKAFHLFEVKLPLMESKLLFKNTMFLQVLINYSTCVNMLHFLGTLFFKLSSYFQKYWAALLFISSNIRVRFHV